MAETIKATIQLRRATEAKWNEIGASFIPKEGEPCLTLDGENAGKVKYGDGINTWSNLLYSISLPPFDEFLNNNVLTQEGWKNIDLKFSEDGKLHISINKIIVGEGVSIAGITEFNINNSLTNVVNNNETSKIFKGMEYIASLTPIPNYVITQVIVLMNGEDITSDVYKDGKIIIAEVTGDITIIATASEKAVPTDIMSNFKNLGPTTYSPGTYTAWCPTGLIYDEIRDTYAHFMNVQSSHWSSPSACELWFNTINPETLQHSEPIFVGRTGEFTTGSVSGKLALGCCIKNGIYYMFGREEVGYFKSEDGGQSWNNFQYETAPDRNPWGCYVLDNGTMIMGSDYGSSQNYCYYSLDNGINWQKSTVSANFNEPTFVDFGNGNVMAICRINADSSGNIQRPVMHTSNDYGKTWTDPVEMQTVGFMGNNNCNAFVHDGYVELFVGCRFPTTSPQFTDTYYEINQYVLDRNKGMVDDFEFVNNIYKFTNQDLREGVVVVSDDFSTPVIAIKNKSNALLMHYAPVGKYVTHILHYVSNLPIPSNIIIPKNLPTTFNVSEEYNGTNSVTICEGRFNDIDGYPSICVDKGYYALLDDIKEGGYVHCVVENKNFFNGWDVPIFTVVDNLICTCGFRDTQVVSTPLPEGYITGQSVVYKKEYYPTNQNVDIYARFWNGTWWIYYNDSWLRNKIDGYDISEASSPVDGDIGYAIPYKYSSLQTYKSVSTWRQQSKKLLKLEYDKII